MFLKHLNEVSNGRTKYKTNKARALLGMDSVERAVGDSAAAVYSFTRGQDQRAVGETVNTSYGKMCALWDDNFFSFCVQVRIHCGFSGESVWSVAGWCFNIKYGTVYIFNNKVLFISL